MTRNYLTGQTTSLNSAVHLETVLLSSNYLSCEAAGLEDATELGMSCFIEPTQHALIEAGQTMMNTFPWVNPFEGLSTTTYPNLVLAFVGNQMTTKASLLPPVGSSRILKEDRIRQDKRPTFSGL